MVAHEGDHLRAHVVAIKSVNVEAIQEARCRRHARLLMATRTQTAFDELRGRRLTKIVRNGAEHYSDLLCIR